jgi:hypothetical protein
LDKEAKKPYSDQPAKAVDFRGQFQQKAASGSSTAQSRDTVNDHRSHHTFRSEY